MSSSHSSSQQVLAQSSLVRRNVVSLHHLHGGKLIEMHLFAVAAAAAAGVLRLARGGGAEDEAGAVAHRAAAALQGIRKKKNKL